MILCCLRPAAVHLVRTLSKGKPVWGVTTLADEIYLLRRKKRHQIEVYDVVTYSLQRRLTVPDAVSLTDIASCEHFQCVYVASDARRCVHRVGLVGDFGQWDVQDRPVGLSVNAAHHLLVTCLRAGKIKEFTSAGHLLQEIALPDGVVNPRHAIQTRDDEFAVCHGDLFEPVHGVCKVSADGRRIGSVHTYGGVGDATQRVTTITAGRQIRLSDAGRYTCPFYLAPGAYGSMFLADFHNRRVALLSSNLSHVTDAVSRDQLSKWRPVRLHVQHGRLYVAANNWMNTSGRVLVFRI